VTAPPVRAIPGLPARSGFGEDATPFVATLLDPAGVLEADRVAEAFKLTKFQLADVLGLSRETLYKSSRANAPKTQARLREMLEMDARERREPETGQLTRRLIARGITGILVPSFAPGATRSHDNLVLNWDEQPPLRVFDPSGRLPRNQLSWD